MPPVSIQARCQFLANSHFCVKWIIERGCHFWANLYFCVNLKPLKANVIFGWSLFLCHLNHWRQVTFFWVTAAPHSWAVTAAPDLTEEKGGEEGWDQESRMESGTLCEGFVGWLGDIRALKMSSGWRRICMGYIRNPQKGFYHEIMAGSMIS